MDALSFAFDANFKYQDFCGDSTLYAVDLVTKYKLSKAWTAGFNCEYGNESYGDMTRWRLLRLAVGRARGRQRAHPEARLRVRQRGRH